MSWAWNAGGLPSQQVQVGPEARGQSWEAGPLPGCEQDNLCLSAGDGDTGDFCVGDAGVCPRVQGTKSHSTWCPIYLKK